MGKILTFILAFVSMIMLLQTVYAFERGESKYIFRVVDENGEPVHQARIRGGAWWPDAEKVKHPLLNNKRFDVYTDTEGSATVETVVYTDMRFSIQKKGYYDYDDTYDFYSKDQKMTLKDGRWQPWGITNEVVLKRIRNPISMYVKRVDDIVPVMGQAVGYDLEKGDWVGDHGSGVISDLIFTVTGNYVDSFNRDLQMTVMFSNPEDGIITQIVPMHKGNPRGSTFRSAHEAPSTGYEPTYSYIRKMREKLTDCVNMDTRSGQLVYYRVRTEVDDKGNIVKAWYGKMHGDFHCYFRSDRNARISFTYYLNPAPNDRNVEYDPKQNLFNWSRREYKQQNFKP